MRTAAVCPVCLEEQAKSATSPVLSPLSGELDDCGYIHVECAQGHYGVVIFNARRYEVLMQSAAQAFVDGYTNEVIAVMSAALERAYEFYIRVSCRAKSISNDALQIAWKGVASQSERQFGAFQFLYLIDHGQAFKLDKAITETRNNIVHKGRIAREKEALSFAENVFRHVRVIEESIKSKFPQDADKESTQEVDVQKAHIPEGVVTITLKKQTVRVDASKNEVVGVVDSFLDMVRAVVERRSRGFPD